MTQTLSSSRGDEASISRVPIAEAPGYQAVAGPAWVLRTHSATDGPAPFEVTGGLLSEDESEEQYWADVVQPRSGEPTVSTDEVERELGKDGLL